MELVLILTMLLYLCAVLLAVFAAADAVYILEGIALTKLANRKGIKSLWLVWVPGVLVVGKLNMMAQLTEETDFRLFGGKLKFPNKLTPSWIYLGIAVGCVVLNTLNSCLSWIPVVGFLFAMLTLMLIIPACVGACFIEYGYVRDLLNAYRPGNPANVKTAVWLTVGNQLSMGLARAIYLFIFAKKHTAPVVCEEIPEEN